MPDKLWKQVTGPSDGLVQKHFIEARKEELKRRNPMLEEKVKRVLIELNPGLKPDKWLDAYRKINRNLQSTDLTINFRPEAWFTTENNYASYTQTYERASASAGGQKILMSDLLNPAARRAGTDDNVTFPKEWNSAVNPTHRGLLPGRQPVQRIQRQMEFGQQKSIVSEDLWSDKFATPIGVESMNPYFNPKTKQVFAALNYGRRPNGSTVKYGKAFLILHPRFKLNALYFPIDTFYLNNLNPELGANAQVSYGCLGAILGMENLVINKAIIESCFNDHMLPNGDGANDLLEGHIFEELTFTNNLTAVCLPVNYKDTPLGVNAKKFAVKHGAKLHWIC